MSDSPSSAETSPAAFRTHIEAEIADIAYVHRTLNPERELWLDLWWKTAPVAVPAIRPADEACGPQHFAPAYLGRLKIQDDPGLGRTPLRVEALSTPPPTTAQIAGGHRPWRARPLRDRFGFALSPMLFEHVKYQLDRRAERIAGKHANFQKLPLSRNIMFRPEPDTRMAGAARDPAILIGFHWLEVGGAEKLAFDTVGWALDAGLRVFVISDRDGLHRQHANLPVDPRVRFVRSDRHLPRRLYPAFLRRLVMQENIQLTHNHHCNILYECLADLRGSFPDLRHIDSLHIVEPKNGGYPRISGVWSNFIDMHHVISGELKRWHEERFGSHGKIQLGRLLDPSRRDLIPSPPRLDPKSKTCRIAFVGRMVHQKRPLVAVEVARRLLRWGRRAGIAFKFDFVGEGEYREGVRKMLRRHGLRDAVGLHPANTDVPSLLAKSDMLLVSSANEGLALVCYEAIEQGCIPVSTDVGAQREIVPPDLLTPREPYAAAARMSAIVRKLLTDQAFLERNSQLLHDQFRSLAQDPVAREVLMPIYREAASDDAAAGEGIQKDKRYPDSTPRIDKSAS